MSSNSLVHHNAVAHYLRFAGSTGGRDKLLRTIQYFSRFYMHHLQTRGSSQSAIDVYAGLKNHVSTTRHLLRVGTFIDHLHTAALAYYNKQYPAGSLARFLTIGYEICYAGYLACDSALVMSDLGVQKVASVGKVHDAAYRFWASALIYRIVSAVHRLRQFRCKEGTLNHQEAEDKLESKDIRRQRYSVCIQLLADLCDLTIPVVELKIFGLNDGLVGIAGTISSVIGILTQWRKTA